MIDIQPTTAAEQACDAVAADILRRAPAPLSKPEPMARPQTLSDTDGQVYALVAGGQVGYQPGVGLWISEFGWRRDGRWGRLRQRLIPDEVYLRRGWPYINKRAERRKRSKGRRKAKDRA